MSIRKETAAPAAPGKEKKQGDVSALPGLFLTVEGIDGVGKSTQIENIRAYFKRKGYRILTETEAEGRASAGRKEGERPLAGGVLFTREPGGTPLGEAIRGILLDPAYPQMCPQTEALLYAAARAQLVREVIRPCLEGGGIVVCDRFLDSSIAYQGWGRDLGRTVLRINESAVDGLSPMLTFLLDLSPEKAHRRMEERNKRKRLAGRAEKIDRLEAEGAAFQERIRAGYLALLEEDKRSGRGRIVALDASLSPEEIGKKIEACLDTVLRHRKL